MNAESSQAAQKPLWNRGKALSYKYNAITFTIFNALFSLGIVAILALRWSKFSHQLWDVRYPYLFVVIMAPLLTPLTALSARGLAKMLTPGGEYHKDIMWTIWYALSLQLLVCYGLLMGAIFVAGFH